MRLQEVVKDRSLACCRPWGHKESDTTEQLNNKKQVTLRQRGEQATLLCSVVLCKTDLGDLGVQFQTTAVKQLLKKKKKSHKCFGFPGHIKVMFILQSIKRATASSLKKQYTYLNFKILYG